MQDRRTSNKPSNKTAANVVSASCVSGFLKAAFVPLSAFVYSCSALSENLLHTPPRLFRKAIEHALKAFCKWPCGCSFSSGMIKSMKARPFPSPGITTKLETKLQLACCSMEMLSGRTTACFMDGLVVLVNIKDTFMPPDVESGFPVPVFIASPLLLAFRARRSVACVSLRKIRSNSSLYPGHCLRDLVH